MLDNPLFSSSLRHLLILAMPVLVQLAPGCTSGRHSVHDGLTTTARDSTRVDSTASVVPPPDGVTPNPLDATREANNDPVVLAERLGRLDAMIRRAPPDSARFLREEYDRLLENYTGEPRSAATGSASLENPAYQFLPEARRSAAPESVVSADTHMRGSIARTFRARRARIVPAERTRTTRAASGSVRSDAQRLSRSRATARSAPSPRPASESAPTARSTVDANRTYVEGLAASRAGDVGTATRELPLAIESGQLSSSNRARAEHALGGSLELAGDPADAAAAYTRASRASAELRDRAFVDHCRALAQSGRRAEARRMLRAFILRSPKSPQVVAARLLLQTL